MVGSRKECRIFVVTRIKVKECDWLQQDYVKDIGIYLDKYTVFLIMFDLYCKDKFVSIIY